MSNEPTADETIRKLKAMLAAHEKLMLEQNGRPDCKNWALAETIKDKILKEEK